MRSLKYFALGLLGGAIVAVPTLAVVKLAVWLAGNEPYTSAEVVRAIDECQAAALEVYWVRGSRTGVIIGHQCGAASFGDRER